MSPRAAIGLSIGAALLALSAVIALSQSTGLDLALQDLLYLPSRHRWLVDSHAPGPRLLFYDLPKWALYLAAPPLLGALAGPRRVGRALRLSRREALYLVLCLSLVPGLVAVAKATTGVHCPRELQRYGGRAAARSLLASIREPDPDRRGRCWPAGHPSGGFALMSLFFVASRRRRWAGLAAGLAAGSVLGAYQILKGAHFLSHVLVTLTVAWICVAALALALGVGPAARDHQ